jgi:hypothetical protein
MTIHVDPRAAPLIKICECLSLLASDHDGERLAAQSEISPPTLWRPCITDMADYVLRNTRDLHIVIGPVLYQLSDGSSSKAWYFVVACAGLG